MANFFDQFDGPPSGGGSSPFASAISSVESGGNYRAVGPETGKGRALGKYQVMTSNIGPWSREILGREVTPTEFMADPKIQDAIFEGKFGQYVQKYGPENASKAWFAGEKGMHNPNARDILGTTVDSYAKKFTNALPAGAMAFNGQPAANAAPGVTAERPVPAFEAERPQPKNFFDQFDGAEQPAQPQGDTFAARFDAVSDRAAFDAVPVQEKKFGLGDTWPARIAKSIAGAVTLPGDVMQGKISITGEDGRTNPEVIERSFDLAGVASPTSVANRVAPKVIPAKPASAPSVAELKGAASAGYESPEVAGLVIKSPAVTNFANRVRSELNEAGFDENVAPKVMGILSKLDEAPAGSFVTGKNLNSIRKTLGKAAGSPDPSERAAAQAAIEALDDFVPGLAKSDIVRGDPAAASKVLTEARANYSAAKHAETIDKKTVQAELRAAAANSGQNVANTIRQRLADVLIKDKERRGFTESELAMMKQIVEGTRGQNTVRAVGNLLGGGGGLGAVAAAAAGGWATGGPGAVAPLVGFVLKSASNKMTIKQAERLSEAIRNRAPLASAGRKFEEKAASFAQDRSPKTVAAVALAARNFATNLQASGFNINARDLMGGLQLGGVGRADGEQQDVERKPGQ